VDGEVRGNGPVLVPRPGKKWEILPGSGRLFKRTLLFLQDLFNLGAEWERGGRKAFVNGYRRLQTGRRREGDYGYINELVDILKFYGIKNKKHKN